MRSQRMAAHALERVKRNGFEPVRGGARQGGERDVNKKYATQCMKFPSLLHDAGGVQAVTFVLARGKEAGVLYLDDLAAAVGHADGRALHRALRGEGPPEAQALGRYLSLTSELAEAAQWFRRMCQAELKVDETELGDAGEAE